MSTHSSHIPPTEIGNDTYESIDDLFDEFTKKVSVVKTFSNSSLDSLKQEAKKLEKSLSINHKEALNKVALSRGFKSFKDCSNQFKYWQSLPSIYIHISNNTSASYSKDVFSRLPQDDKSKSMKELMRHTNISRLDVQESTSIRDLPISALDNYTLGIKLLNKTEKDDFLKSNKDSNRISRINKEKDFIFKFIYYKFDPIEEKKIRNDIEERIKKYGYQFFDTNAEYQITKLIDQQLYALLNTESYTDDTLIRESYSISPDGYITNNTYYDTVDLYDYMPDFFDPISDSD